MLRLGKRNVCWEPEGREELLKKDGADEFSIRAIFFRNRVDFLLTKIYNGKQKVRCNCDNKDGTSKD